MGYNKHDKIRQIIDQWLSDNITDSKYSQVSFIVMEEEDKIVILSQYPGVLIGKAGECVNKLKDLFTENNINYDIDFVELSTYKSREINVDRLSSLHYRLHDSVERSIKEIDDYNVKDNHPGCSEKYQLGVAEGLDIASGIISANTGVK